jgi:predicted ABC-type ATPase
MTNPRALIIAGPNGAGKTNFAREFLPNEWRCLTFINADLIAVGLAPFTPESAALSAAKLMAQAMATAVASRQSFVVESTLSGRSYLGLIQHWQKVGYLVKVIFLRLPHAELAIERVRLRVSQGGHDITEDVIRRRFTQGWTNSQELYRPIVDEWTLFDASGLPPRLIKSGKKP